MNLNFGGYGFAISFDPTNLFQVGFYENQERDPAQQNQVQNQVQNGPDLTLLKAICTDNSTPQAIVDAVLDDPEFIKNPPEYVNAWDAMQSYSREYRGNEDDEALRRIKGRLALNVPTYWSSLPADAIIIKVLDAPEYQASPEAYFAKWSQALSDRGASRPEEDNAMCWLKSKRQCELSLDWLGVILKDATSQSVVVASILGEPAFQRNPEVYMKMWDERRGDSLACREVEDGARSFIKRCMDIQG